jgi:4-hydroxybenzoate polyprenyltransferase
VRRTLDAEPRPRAAAARDWASAVTLRPLGENLPVLLPLFAVDDPLGGLALGLAISAFLVFWLASASLSIVGSLLRVAPDRVDPARRVAPFAAGRLSLAEGVVGAALLGLAALLASAVLLPTAVAVALAAFLAVGVFAAGAAGPGRVVGAIGLGLLRILGGALSLGLL